MSKSRNERVIDDLVEIVGGNKADLARRLNVLPQDINNWRRRGVPLNKCALIEHELGYPMRQLRPDVFDMSAA